MLPATGSTPVATYAYDPLDRLRTVDYGGGSRVRFRYTGTTASAAQESFDATGAVVSIANSWTGEHLEDWTGSGPAMALRVYGTDGHGDVTWAAGTGGAVAATARYDAFGAAASVTGSMPDFRFQGSWADGATGLSWAVARWYAPAQGAFVSEDTLLGTPSDPGSRHLYAYGAGDPVGRWDPNGRAALGTCWGLGCTASSIGPYRLAQWTFFFLRFPGTQCGYHCYGQVPQGGLGNGGAMASFMRWEVASGRLSSPWWSRVNREIVQGSLSAWRMFDLGRHPVRPTAADSTYLWFRYASGGPYVTSGPLATWQPGYYGGSRAQVWAAHQRALWNGITAAAGLFDLEPIAERLVIMKVLVNVEWYYRSWPNLDAALGFAIQMAGYPSHYPASVGQACGMWYPRNVTFGPISVDPYSWQGSKPELERQVCG